MAGSSSVVQVIVVVLFAAAAILGIILMAPDGQLASPKTTGTPVTPLTPSTPAAAKTSEKQRRATANPEPVKSNTKSQPTTTSSKSADGAIPASKLFDSSKETKRASSTIAKAKSSSAATATSTEKKATFEVPPVAEVPPVPASAIDSIIAIDTAVHVEQIEEAHRRLTEANPSGHGSVLIGTTRIDYNINPALTAEQNAEIYCIDHWDTGFSELLRQNNYHDWKWENCARFLAYEVTQSFVPTEVQPPDNVHHEPPRLTSLDPVEYIHGTIQLGNSRIDYSMNPMLSEQANAEVYCVSRWGRDLEILLQENDMTDWNWDNCARFLAYEAARTFVRGASTLEVQPGSSDLIPNEARPTEEAVLRGLITLGHTKLEFAMNPAVSLDDNAVWFCRERWESVMVPVIQENNLFDWNWDNCATFLAYEVGHTFVPYGSDNTPHDDHHDDSHIVPEERVRVDEDYPIHRFHVHFGEATIVYTIDDREGSHADIAEAYCAKHWDTGLSEVLANNGYHDWTRENCGRFMAHEVSQQFRVTTPPVAAAVEESTAHVNEHTQESVPALVRGSIRFGNDVVRYWYNPEASLEANTKHFCETQWESEKTQLREVLHRNNYNDWTLENCGTFLAYEIQHRFEPDGREEPAPVQVQHEEPVPVPPAPVHEEPVHNVRHGKLRLGKSFIEYTIDDRQGTNAQIAESYCAQHWDTGLSAFLAENNFYDWTRENCGAFLAYEVSQHFEEDDPTPAAPVEHVPEPVHVGEHHEEQPDATHGQIRIGKDMIHYTIYRSISGQETAERYCAEHWDTGLSQVLAANDYYDWNKDNCGAYLAFEASRAFVPNA